MNYTEQFFKDKTDLPSFNDTCNSLGNNYDAMVFYLQAFELWLEKKGALTKLRNARTSTNKLKAEICAFYVKKSLCAWDTSISCGDCGPCHAQRKPSAV